MEINPDITSVTLKLQNEKRNNAIPEYKQFIRGKRKVSHISPAWDDYDVHTEKNWKSLKNQETIYEKIQSDVKRLTLTWIKSW